jgi:hypothetical protein
MGCGLFPPGVSFVAIIFGAELFTRGVEWLRSSEGTVRRMLAAAGWQVSGTDPQTGKALTTW